MRAPEARGVPPGGLAWLGLVVALSPLLFDLARHWLAEPWALPFAVFAPLLVQAIHTDPSIARPRRAGLLLLALALALEFVTAGGGMPRYGRPAIPLGVLGMALLLGRPSVARALVAIWLAPIPHALQTRLLPGLEATLDGLAALLGLPLGVEKHLLAAPAGFLEVSGADSGIVLAGLLAGLGWYAAATAGASVRGAAAAALRWALWAPFVQGATWGLVLALLTAGADPELARVVLTALPPLTVFVGAAAWLRRRASACADSLASPALSSRQGSAA